MQHADYHKTYDEGFFHRADGIDHWQRGKMRYGDAVATVAYALGFTSWESVRDLFGCSILGKESNGDDRTAVQQIDALVRHQTRFPKSVLDVGGGRGEVATAFVHAGVPKVQLVEPHAKGSEWFMQSLLKLFKMTVLGASVRFSNQTVPECLGELELDDVDTVTFVESLEHIPEDCFQPFWDAVKPVLVKNKGMLIVANWIDYHPLLPTNAEHCRLVDDALYERLAEGGTIMVRKGSHLVVQY